jgi:hypothetical protein
MELKKSIAVMLLFVGVAFGQDAAKVTTRYTRGTGPGTAGSVNGVIDPGLNFPQYMPGSQVVFCHEVQTDSQGNQTCVTNSPASENKEGGTRKLAVGHPAARANDVETHVQQ